MNHVNSRANTMSEQQQEHVEARTNDEQATGDVAEVSGQQTEAAGEPPSGPAETLNSEQLVPVSEAKRYRKRAQSAERRVSELEAELARSRTALDQHEQTLTELQRRQQIDAALTQQQAIDLDTARLLAERALSEAEEPDVETVVSELRRRKPHLFRHTSSAGMASVSGPRPVNGARGMKDNLEHAAVEAAATGRRTDLLRYLRLRRDRS